MAMRLGGRSWGQRGGLYRSSAQSEQPGVGCDSDPHLSASAFSALRAERPAAAPEASFGATTRGLRG